MRDELLASGMLSNWPAPSGRAAPVPFCWLSAGPWLALSAAAPPGSAPHLAALWTRQGWSPTPRPAVAPEFWQGHPSRLWPGLVWREAMRVMCQPKVSTAFFLRSLTWTSDHHTINKPTSTILITALKYLMPPKHDFLAGSYAWLQWKAY